MRISGLTALAVAAAALLISGAPVEAGAISCPPTASGGATKAGETAWSHPYQGPLVSVEMRTETSGDRKQNQTTEGETHSDGEGEGLGSSVRVKADEGLEDRGC